MSAYWICVYKAVHDQDKVTAYAELAGPAIRDGGGRFLARGNPDHALEGASLLRTTLIEFPSVQAAYDAYHSTAYQEALRVLGDAADREIRIIRAVE